MADAPPEVRGDGGGDDVSRETIDDSSPSEPIEPERTPRLALSDFGIPEREIDRILNLQLRPPTIDEIDQAIAVVESYQAAKPVRNKVGLFKQALAKGWSINE